MSTMVDSFGGAGFVHRKPLPQRAANPPQLVPDTQQNLHNRTRTSSSSVFPSYAPQPAYPPTALQYQAGTARRTLSNATTSTTSTNNSGNNSNGNMARTDSGSVHRSSSIRSGNSPTSYVALMRKQKATVWCDRAQHEDPRLMAQQRAAKMRANIEMVGGEGRSSTSSSGVSGVRHKIRHHGAMKVRPYAPGHVAGSGVPTRLVASEADEADGEDSTDGYLGAGSTYHQRTGSGRSSVGSGRRVSSIGPGSSNNNYYYNTAQPGRLSTSSTPPSGHAGNSSDPATAIHTEEETPVPGDYQRDYFQGSSGTGLSHNSGSSSGERENSFGNLGQMPETKRMGINGEDDKKKTTSDELRRRGSVDDRTMTMSGVRLYVANPDLSD